MIVQCPDRHDVERARQFLQGVENLARLGGAGNAANRLGKAKRHLAA